MKNIINKTDFFLYIPWTKPGGPQFLMFTILLFQSINLYYMGKKKEITKEKNLQKDI